MNALNEIYEQTQKEGTNNGPVCNFLPDRHDIIELKLLGIFLLHVKYWCMRMHATNHMGIIYKRQTNIPMNI